MFSLKTELCMCFHLNATGFDIFCYIMQWNVYVKTPSESFLLHEHFYQDIVFK